MQSKTCSEFPVPFGGGQHVGDDSARVQCPTCGDQIEGPIVYEWMGFVFPRGVARIVAHEAEMAR